MRIEREYEGVEVWAVGRNENERVECCGEATRCRWRELIAKAELLYLGPRANKSAKCLVGYEERHGGDVKNEDGEAIKHSKGG